MAKSRNWFEHAMRRTGWKPERQFVALVALGFALALILGALYLSQVAREATTNRRLRELLEQRDDLERINEQLRADIAQLESVPALRTRAQALGFVDAGRNDIDYLPVDGYVPPRVDTVAPIEEEPDIPDIEPGEQERFTDWLERQWRSLRNRVEAALGNEDSDN